MYSELYNPSLEEEEEEEEEIKKTEMADHQFFQTFKQTLSLADINPDIEFANYFSGLYTNDEEASALNFHNSINTVLPQNWENLHGLFVYDDNPVLTPPQPIISKEGERKRKAMEMNTITPESSSANIRSYSSPQVSDSGSRKTKRAGRGKKPKKGEQKEDEKPREVIHVRAKRGQATDSHSLAERVRRGKINERLKCLQDIVPGCCKTMGMAVMLDEIINYVQSLQNQVDFLSMKLTAASSYYDFNTDIDAMEAMQRENAFEAVKAERIANEEVPSAQFSQLGQNYGYCTQLPHRR